MSEDKEKNLEKSEEPSSEGNNNGGLSLGAILNESMQDGDVFDALAFLDSKPENKKKKQEKQEKAVVSEEHEKNSVVQESVPINTGNTTRPASNEPKKISEALGLSKPQPPKITTPKKTVAKKVKKPASASKITDGVPISEALKKSISKTGSEPLDIKDIKLTPEEASQPVFVKEPTIAPSAAKKTIVKKSPSGSKGAAKKGKLLKVVALLLAFGAVFAVMAKLGFSDVKKQDKNIAEALAINKNTHNGRNVSGGDFSNQGYEQNISDWLPKDENASVADSASQWSGGDSEQYQYPQGTHWEADLTLGDSDDDYSLNGYVANSSDYDFSSFSDTSYNSGADSYYGGYSGGSSFNFGSSWGGGGGGGSSTSASFSTPSNTSSSSQSNNSDESEVVVQQENPKNTGRNANKKPIIPGGNYTEEEKKKLSIDNKPVLNLQSTSATPAFSNSADISKSNFGSSFNQDVDGKGGTHRADPFSEGGKMTMDNTGKGGIGEGSLKDALSSAKGAGGSVSGPEDVPNGVDDNKGDSGSGGGSSGGGGGGGGSNSASMSNNVSSSDNNSSDDGDKKDDGKKENEKSKDKDKSDDTDYGKSNYNPTGNVDSNPTQSTQTVVNNNSVPVSTSTAKPNSSSSGAKPVSGTTQKKCDGELKDYYPGQAGILPEAQQQNFVSNGRTLCMSKDYPEGCGGTYYRYYDDSVSFVVTEDCKLQVIIIGHQVETDYQSNATVTKRYQDVFSVGDAKTGGSTIRTNLVFTN